MPRFQTKGSVSTRPPRKSFTAVALILALSAALGAATASPARADDPKWECSIDISCVPGGNVACKVVCDHSGCDCNAWDPQ